MEEIQDGGEDGAAPNKIGECLKQMKQQRLSHDLSKGVMSKQAQWPAKIMTSAEGGMKEYGGIY